MELWELTARERVRDTVATYAHCADSGRFDELVALFADDGVLEAHGEEPHRGRAAILAFLAGVSTDLAETSEQRLIRHYTSNLRIDVVSPAEARAACYFLVVTERGVDHWGRYRDRLAPAPGPGDDRWLFAHRFVRTDGVVPGGFGAMRTTR